MKKLNFFLLVIIWVQSYSQTSNPIELGKVNWLRDFQASLIESQKQSKPILILFQEVPGCMTCQRYGDEVLSHPLIVEAIETLFVPLAIFNNKRGRDAKVLQMYQEPSWNNPVLRIVDAEGENILPRYAGEYSPGAVVSFLVDALRLLGTPVPQYLSLLREELSSRDHLSSATIGMFCFWTGEKVFGGIQGIVDTEAGFMQSREVVRVQYDPKQVSLEEIIEKGSSADCADEIFLEKDQQKLLQSKISINRVKQLGEFIPDKTPKYYLSRTHFASVPMSPIQRLKANYLLGSGRSPESVLSPLQNQMANYIATQPQIEWSSLIQCAEWHREYFKLKTKLLTP